METYRVWGVGGRLEPALCVLKPCVWETLYEYACVHARVRAFVGMQMFACVYVCSREKVYAQNFKSVCACSHVCVCVLFECVYLSMTIHMRVCVLVLKNSTTYEPRNCRWSVINIEQFVVPCYIHTEIDRVTATQTDVWCRKMYPARYFQCRSTLVLLAFHWGTMHGLSQLTESNDQRYWCTYRSLGH